MRPSQGGHLRAVLLGLLVAGALYAAFGMLTAILSNPFFSRMTPVRWYDHVFLVLTALLSGAYVGLWAYGRTQRKVCDYAATGGAVGGVFAFGCAVCNQLLVALLGVSGVLMYFAPLQPFLGVASVAVLGAAVYGRLKPLLA